MALEGKDLKKTWRLIKITVYSLIFTSTSAEKKEQFELKDLMSIR